MKCGIIWRKKERLWIFKAIDRATGEQLAIACGDRSLRTVALLYERLGHLRIGHFYTDGYEGFASVLPYDRLTQTKKETHAIERHNCRTRHWLKRFCRKTIAFSRSQRMVEASLALLNEYIFRPGANLMELCPDFYNLL